MNLKIKEMPKEERPRERLMCYGVEKLSNEELLAILLKTGTKEMSAKVLASYILREIDGVSGFQHCSYQTLSRMKGVGNAKACTIFAAIELGKRVLQKAPILFQKFEDAYQVASYYWDKLGNLKQEYFICVYLDVTKKLIHEKVLFMSPKCATDDLLKAFAMPRIACDLPFCALCDCEWSNSGGNLIAISHPGTQNNCPISSLTTVSFFERSSKSGLMKGLFSCGRTWTIGLSQEMSFICFVFSMSL